MSQHKKIDEDFRPGFLRDRDDLPTEEERVVLSERFVQFTRLLFPNLYNEPYVTYDEEQREKLREEYVFFLGRYPEQFKHSTQGFTYFDHINQFLGNPAPFQLDDMLRVLVRHDHSQEEEDGDVETE